MANAKIVIGSTGGQVNFSKVTSPDIPPAGYVALYAQNVSGTDTVRAIDSAGNIINFGGGSGTNGTSGTSGVNGSSGSSGSNGSSGTSGSSGLSGSSGTSGVSGSSGTSGANGSSGTSGANGSSGTSGLNGSSGTSGSSGSSGTSGSSGSSGTSGVDGSSGTSGANGTSGTSGSDGSSGTSGSSGSSGTSGSSGSSGTSGVDGSSGTSGINGSSGTSGSDGSSGTSGISSAPSPIIEIANNTLISDAIGATSNVCNSLVFGVNAQSICGGNNIVIGTCAYANNLYGTVDRGGIAIGCCSRSEGVATISIGDNAFAAQGAFGVAIGYGSVSADSNVSIGYAAQSTAGGAVTIGALARGNGGYFIAIGQEACGVAGQDNGGSIAIGYRSCVQGLFNTLLGGFSCSFQANSVTIGSCNISCSASTIVIGSNSSATSATPNSIVVGNLAKTCFSGRNIAIGYCSYAANQFTCEADRGAIAIGDGASATSRGSLAIGEQATTYGGEYGIAVGRQASAGNYGYAFGHQTLAQNGSFAAAGYAKANGSISVAIGENACSQTGSAIAIGPLVTSCGCASISIGRQSCTNADCAVSLGICSSSCHTSAVVLGTCITSKVANTVHMNNFYLAGPTGPYASDACFYAAGGTAGQAYLLCVGSDTYLTIGGYN